MNLEESIKSFIKKESRGPFLLALSGGPDSMALFHLFISSKVDFHVCHVNHNWRQESSSECEQLKSLSQNLKIPFHSKELFPENMTGNLEDACRKERLIFFKKIIEDHHLKGVVMGHHADDLAETVLKRLFEGASLFRLKGLSLRSFYDNMLIFRPLLPIRKKEILDWLQEKNHTYFFDKTNEDTIYLRTRLRQDIFPHLSSCFGKEIVPSLVRISQASEELEEFLDDYLTSFRLKTKQLKNKVSLDFSQENINGKFLWKIIIKDFFNRQGLTVSTPTLEMVIHLLCKAQGEKELLIRNKKVIIYKKTLSIVSNDIY